MNNTPMRTGKFIAGLHDMIKYISSFRNTSEMSMVEIGAFAGDATRIFCDNFKNVVAVDPWDSENMNVQNVDPEEVYGKFIQKMDGYGNLKIHRTTSLQASVDLRLQGCNFDFVYIDAIHDFEHEQQDINLWRSFIPAGGFIGGHDYHSKWQGVIDAVNSRFGCPDKVFQDTSWIVRI